MSLYDRNCEYCLVKIVYMFWPKLWILFSQLWIFVAQNCKYLLFKIMNICWSKLRIPLNRKIYFVWIYWLVSNFGRNFDQTSTPVSKCGRVLVYMSTKLRPNFDQTSTPPVSKFGRSLLYIKWNTFWSQGVRSTVDQTLTPNFDTPVSKFARNFDQTSPKLRLDT